MVKRLCAVGMVALAAGGCTMGTIERVPRAAPRAPLMDAVAACLAAERRAMLVAWGGRLDPRWPDHALSSFGRTADAGAVVIGASVRQTADGVPVLLADRALEAGTNGTGPVDGRTWAEVRALWLKDGAGRLVDERVASLDEALVWARRRAAVLLLKPDGVEPGAIVARAREAGAMGQTILWARTAAEARDWRARQSGMAVAAPDGGDMRLGVAGTAVEAAPLAATGHVLVATNDPRGAGAVLRAAGREPGPCLGAAREQRR